MLREDVRRSVGPWLASPVAMTTLYARGFYFTFVPRRGNNSFRKILAILLMLTWIAVTLGEAFGYAQVGTIRYGLMSAVIYTIIGIQWGFTLGNLVQIDDPREEDDG